MGENRERSASPAKQQLREELLVKAELVTDGVAISKEALAAIRVGTAAQEQVHCLFEMDHAVHDFDLPSGFYLPHGLSVPFRWNPESSYLITTDQDRLQLVSKEQSLGEVKFHPRPAFYDSATSDGTPMNTVAVYRPDHLPTSGHLFVVYSNECSYKEKGEDCLFCNINFTKDTYAEKEGIFWKTPRQIAETVAAAHKEGLLNHLTVTGGVIAERRELEYYLDVAEEIRAKTGLDDFNGTATVAAPVDLTNIDRLKEAGYRTIAMNIEVWDENIYRTICPGKANGSAGWSHWVRALEYAVKVFGHGRVRSNIVAGLEPKKKTVEGLEYLASKGIVGTFTVWCPNPGSGLEGHRPPKASWYVDLAEELVSIWRKNGFSYAQIYDAHASSDLLQHDIWRIETEGVSVAAGLSIPS